jgi:hypothetical protein
MRYSKFLVLGSLSCSLIGCSFFGIGGDGDDDGGSSTEDDIAEYEALRLSLETNLEEILPAYGVDSVQAVGDYVTWLDINQGWEAILHIRHYPDGGEWTSEVTVGNEETFAFYRLGDTTAMTAIVEGMSSIYSVIDLETGDLADQVTRPKPDGADYDAYAVYGDKAYLVADSEGKMIYEWTVGSGSPTPIGAIDDTGANFGIFIDFTIIDYGGSLKLLGIGTVGTYAIELDTMIADQIPLPISPLEIGITDNGIAVADGFDLWYVGWEDTEVRAIHDELKANAYELNTSFNNSHWMGSGFAQQDVSGSGNRIIYRSTSGVHAYDTTTNTVTPILLDDNGYSSETPLYIHYTGINTTENAMFVYGLESTSGATGADGPIYRLSPLP